MFGLDLVEDAHSIHFVVLTTPGYEKASAVIGSQLLVIHVPLCAL